MNYENPDFIEFVTPICGFKYSWLVEADTKFDKNEYKVHCLIPADKGTEISDKLDEMLQQWKATCKEYDPKKAWKLVDPQPWAYEQEDGNPVLVLKCKRRAAGVRKDGTTWSVQLPIFDSKGALVTNRAPLQKLGPGSEGRVKLRAQPYSAPIGVGISLKIQEVQIIKAVEYTAATGFDAVEGGWTDTKEEGTAEVETFAASAAGDF